VTQEKLKILHMYGAANKDIDIFISYCQNAYITYIEQKDLFSNRHLLDEAAPIFFRKLNSVLIEYLILQVCKLGDPAEDKSKNENLSIQFFLKHHPSSDNATFTKLGNEIIKFCAQLMPARHKILAHIDRKTANEGDWLGASTKEEWEKFWGNLQEFLRLLYHPTFRLFDASEVSDMKDLIKILGQTNNRQARTAN